jgi:hypothetical protein
MVIEKFGVQAIFKLPDLSGQRRLRDAQCSRCSREVSMFDHGKKVADIP